MYQGCWYYDFLLILVAQIRKNNNDKAKSKNSVIINNFKHKSDIYLRSLKTK